ncbi:MAG: hypothetical protein C7B47_18175 [Sulfobacillus thermosulfidooxidans]|uniref:Uncharacterized protein n=1 Tax=Sulfobacillus thermosulfidooxidans TaxID=28034 RepID=A0A2T2WDG8_SULTH|nr:MAG: hypothetical protein C7B47_18175 [Sulfobacillus thermosulfidooxidans]
MLSWDTLGTTAGAVLLVHIVLYLTKQFWPQRSRPLIALVTAEGLVWAYGLGSTTWSWAHTVLWSANGLVIAAIALGATPHSRLFPLQKMHPTDKFRR